MADTKISALPAVTTPASADEFAVNQSGTTKKETRAQIHTLESGEFLQGTTGAGLLDLRGDSGASSGVRIKDDGTVLIGSTTPATDAPIMDVVGSAGAIAMSNIDTDAAIKIGVLSVRHFTNAEKGLAVVRGRSTTTTNQVQIGGGSGAHNATRVIELYTAANTTTLTGTLAADLTGVGTASILRLRGDITIDKDLNHDGDKAGFYGTAPITVQTVAADAGAIHQACR